MNLRAQGGPSVFLAEVEKARDTSLSMVKRVQALARATLQHEQLKDSKLGGRKDAIRLREALLQAALDELPKS